MEHNRLATKIADYIQARGTVKLEAFDKDAEKKRKQQLEDAEKLAALDQELAEQRMAWEAHYRPANWLDDAGVRAKQIKMVTHAIKYTHSDAKGSSLYAVDNGLPAYPADGNVVISTASLTKPAIDVVGNAAALDVAGLLLLEHEGETLLDKIKQNDDSALKPFAANKDQLNGWMTEFRKVLDSEQPSSHTFTKQLYFPLEDGYHLVAPLFSSAMADALYKRISFFRYDEVAKEARKAKREARFCPHPVVDFPNTARQNFGGTKPQNISKLNSARGGRSFLLSCAPPAWQPQKKPPIGAKTIFSRNHFGARVYRTIWNARNFLEKQVDKPSIMQVRAKREAYIDELIDHLVHYAAEIQQIQGMRGWSALPECRLGRAEQLWLDPKRAGMDPEFAKERESNDWQGEIADQFARWLNNRIKSSKLSLGDVEHREWQSLLEEKLRLLKDDLRDDLEVFT